MILTSETLCWQIHWKFLSKKIKIDNYLNEISNIE